MLHVAPGEVRVGLQCESNDGGGHGSTGAGPGVFAGALVMQVRGHDLFLLGGAGAVGSGNGGGAWFRVPGDVAILTGAGHGDGVDAGGVAITVTEKERGIYDTI